MLDMMKTELNWRFCVVLFILACPSVSYALTLELKDGRNVVIELPEQWVQDQDDIATYSFRKEKEDGDALMQLSFPSGAFCGPESHADVKSLEHIVILKASTASLGLAGRVPFVRQIKTRISEGFYFSARSVNTDKYGYVQKGAVSVGGKAVLFVLYSTTSFDRIEDIMGILDSAKFSAAKTDN